MAATNARGYKGCPFSVVSIDEVKCLMIGAVGEWTEMSLNSTPSKFSLLTNNEVLRIKAMENEKRKFRNFQTKLLKEIAIEKTKNPYATIDDFTKVKFT